MDTHHKTRWLTLMLVALGVILTLLWLTNNGIIYWQFGKYLLSID